MNEVAIKWKNSNDTQYALDADNLHEIHPSVNCADENFMVVSGLDGLLIKAHTAIKIIVDGVHKVFQFPTDLTFKVGDKLDSGALQVGKDYYVYLVDAGDGTAHISVSLNSTYPDISGATAQNSRKIGGFHTLCLAVGNISNHPLSGYNAGDILPASVWNLNHRPTCSPEGMVYIASMGIWADIYLQSGTGANTVSVYGGTITDTRMWYDHVDDLAAVGKTLLTESEFQAAAEGSNQKTAIAGAKDPGTTGGHVDSAGRRMISNYGLEDCCGAMWQWMDHPSANGGSGWSTQAGNKGDIYGAGYALLAGGGWGAAADCGSRSRDAAHPRTGTGASLAGRGRARSR